MEIIEKRLSKDGSIKYAFKVPNGIVEAIYFNFKGRYGNDSVSSNVICLSSQVGCTYSCSFCETGKIPKVRNLTKEEMVVQVDLIQEDLETHQKKRADYYALMGMGEPLVNLRNVLGFYHQEKSQVRGISLSTVGVVPKIDSLSSDPDVDFVLYISLHTPYNDQRKRLISSRWIWSVEETLSAGKRYSAKKNRRTGLTYMLIPNENDSVQHAKDLVKLIDPNYFFVQLTCFNSGENVQSDRNAFVDSSRLFMKEISKKGIICDIQLSKGVDVEGGCGQLSGRLSSN